MKRFLFLCLFIFACTCVRAQSPLLPYTEDELKTGFALSERRFDVPIEDTLMVFTLPVEKELKFLYLVLRMKELLLGLPYEHGDLHELTITDKKID